jgi:16S rRNA (adenine1518-N6/adenine1519-N6)-dimethyltransferase
MTKLAPLNIPGLLRLHHLLPKKGLGQNFLVDEGALKMVVEAAEVTNESTVLEVGPGLGSLTRHLAVCARRVVAVELDGGLIPPLRQVLAPFKNVQLIQGDIMALDLAALGLEAGYLVTANIPYYITSALIRRLLEAQARPQRIVLTVQKEVAERICAGPGDMSLLALSVQLYGDPSIVGRIPADAFYPAPTVDSAVVRVSLLPAPRLPEPQLEIFFRLAKAGFGQKRKTLRNALGGVLPDARAALLLAGIDPQRRAETLSLAEWGKLAAVVQPG